MKALDSTEVRLSDALSSLNANLLKLQTSMTNGFDKISQKFDRIDERFDKMDDRFDKMDDRFGKVDERIGNLELQVNGKIENIESKLDALKFELTKVNEVIRYEQQYEDNIKFPMVKGRC